MTLKANNFNGGTDGTTITTGNSGGVSGDALEEVTNSPVFSNTQAHSATLSARFPASSFTGLGFELSATTFWIRFYAWLPQNQNSALVRLWSLANATGSYLGGIGTKANGNLDLFCGGATVDVAGAIALNQWIRIEAKFSTTTGAEVWLYNSPESGTPTANATTSANMGETCATQELIRSSATTAFSYFDDFAVSNDGLIGPAVDPVVRNPVIAATAVQRASRW